LFTYETSWLLPFWLLLWALLIPKNSGARKGLIAGGSLLLLLLLIYIPVRQQLTGEYLGTYEADDLVQGRYTSLVMKSIKLLYRTWLPPMQQFTIFGILGTLIAMLHLLLAGIIIKKDLHNGLWWLLLVCWLSAYLPFSSLGISVSGYESERYLYLPSAFGVAWFLLSIYLVLPGRPKWQIGIFLLLFLFHAGFLWKSGNDYKSASNLTAGLITTLQKSPAATTVIIENLPDNWKGIPLFRYGFVEALQWKMGEERWKQVSVVSRKIFNGQMPMMITDSSNDTLRIRFSERAR
jgi:hypothetical protein